MMKKEFELRKISEARPHLMGLATLWIVFFHSIWLNFSQPWLLEHSRLMGFLNLLREEGNCGVDIFLFLSGIGLVFSWSSLQETSDHPIRTFYYRRFSRVLPSVLAVSVLYYGWLGSKGTEDWLGKILFYGNYSAALEGNQYWFFALLFALYLFFPLIWKVVDKWGFGGTAGLVSAVVLGTLALKYFISEHYFKSTEIIWTRIPIFVIGVFFGRMIRQDRKIPVWIPIACLPLAFLTWYEIRRIPPEFLFARRYAYAALTMLITMSHAWICSMGKGKNLLHRAVTRIGVYSMEIYLIYEGLYLYNPLGFRNQDSIGIIYMLTVFVASLLLSALLKTALERLRGTEKAQKN